MGSLVAKFNGVSVLGLGNTLDVVDAVTSSSVQSTARVTGGVRKTGLATNTSVDLGGDRRESSLLGSDDLTVIAVSCRYVSIKINRVGAVDLRQRMYCP